MPTAASTTRPLDTGHLFPTTLEDLNSAASLLTRVDRKYLVASSAAQNVVDALTGRALVLDIDGRRSFSYASAYYDTPGLDSYLQAARKRRHRFKIRTRSYLDSGLTFLEVKTRGPRGATIKQRLDYRAADADRLTEEGIDFVVECLAPLTGSAQEARRTAQSLRPVMATTYRRTTLHLPDDEGRARPLCGRIERLVLDDRRGQDPPDRRRARRIAGRRTVRRRRDEESGPALAHGPIPVGRRPPALADLEVRHRNGGAPPGAARQQVAPAPHPRAGRRRPRGLRPPRRSRPATAGARRARAGAERHSRGPGPLARVTTDLTTHHDRFRDGRAPAAG